MQEIWKDAVEFDGRYEVSNIGRVRSTARKNSTATIKPGNILKPYSDRKGYLSIKLITPDRRKVTAKVHRLVAEAFIPNPENKLTVNHIDGNKQNDNIENLEWATYSENMFHAIRTGLRGDASNPNGGRKKKPIQQYTIDGEYVASYISVASAARATKTDKSSISKAANGTLPQSHGYLWRYGTVV